MVLRTEVKVKVDRALACFSMAYHMDLEVLQGTVSELLRSEAMLPLTGKSALGKQFELALGSAVGSVGKDVNRYQGSDKVTFKIENSIIESDVILACNFQTGFFMATISLDIGSCEDIDLLIGLAHSHGGSQWTSDAVGSVAFLGRTHGSIFHVLSAIMSGLFNLEGSEVECAHRFRIFELRGDECLLGQVESERLQSEVTLATYGLLTGDEGWRHVPPARAQQLLGDFWSSRTFLQVAACDHAVVLFNTKTKEYKDRAKDFFTTRFGQDREYFETDFSLAGLDHGVFFACENALERLILADTLARDIKAEQEKRKRTKKNRLFPQSHLLLREFFGSSLQSAHIRVREYLEALRDTDVAEINGMLSLIVDRSGVAKYEARVREYADLMDQELDRVWNFQLTRIAVLISTVSLVCSVTSLLIVLKAL